MLLFPDFIMNFSAHACHSTRILECRVLFVFGSAHARVLLRRTPSDSECRVPLWPCTGTQHTAALSTAHVWRSRPDYICTHHDTAVFMISQYGFYMDKAKAILIQWVHFTDLFRPAGTVDPAPGLAAISLKSQNYQVNP